MFPLMEFSAISVLVALAALVIGGLIGWFVARGPVTEMRAREQEARESASSAEAEVGRLNTELARAEARAARIDELTQELVEARKKRDALSELYGPAEERAQRVPKLEEELAELREKYRTTDVELTRLRTESEERERAFAERAAEKEAAFAKEYKRLVEAEEKLQAKFGEISEKMLEGAQARFLEGAQTKLAAMNKESMAELDKRVGPVGETLERYRKRVEEIEKNRSEAWHQLQGVIGEVRAGQERVLDGANRITTTLQGATKARGDWGELQFENLLDACNLRGQTDFAREVGVKDDEGRDKRPDAIINIPGGRKLVVDVKNVFNTYKQANEAETEEERSVLLAKHAKEVRGHIQALSAKRYQDTVEGSADFVVMFVPGEHVLYAALTQDDGLLNYALERGVVLSSPLNFMSIALTVATVWRQAGVQADAQEIAALGKQIYDRLATVAAHISNVRRDLGKTNNSFDKLVGSFDTNLRKAGERFEELSVDTSAKDMAEALPLNSQPRKLVNFADNEQDEVANTASSALEESQDAAE